MPVFIDPVICDGEEICEVMKICPRDAILQNEKGIAIDQSKCNECLLCLKACPYLAVKLLEDARKGRGSRLGKGAHLLRIYGVEPGRIGRPLLKESNFKKKISSKTPTLVVFWGAHSGVMAPFVREIGKRYGRRMRVAYVKVKENPKLCKRYSVKSTPTLILFKKGRQVSRLEGVRHKETLRVWVESNLT